MPTIILPTLKLRDYQIPQFKARDEGLNRFYKVWHRRAGKDLSDFNFIVREAMKKKGTYWHMLPKYNQARKAIWQGMTKDGKRFIDYAPKEIIEKVQNQEMRIELKNGSMIQIVGSDNVDSLVGTNPLGIVFSEYALTNPKAWGLLEPILAENGGWAVFNTTPRGKNHAYELLQAVKHRKDWLTQILTVEDTNVIPLSYIEDLRERGVSEEVIQQEYFCSFEGSLEGAYYAEQIRYLEKEERITAVPYVEEKPVHTYWDIGISDYTSIWFVQAVGREWRVIDFLQNNGKGLDYYIKELKYRGYNYGEHYLPHDANRREIMTGKKIISQLEEMWEGQSFEYLTRTNDVNADITATRAFLKRCVFDAVKCEEGLNCLKSYRKKWSDIKQCYEDKPYHDWASHAADAFRYFAINNATAEDMSVADKGIYNTIIIPEQEQEYGTLSDYF